MGIQTLLHARVPCQLKISRLRGVDGVVGPPHHSAGWSASRIDPVAHDSDVSLHHCRLQTFALFFADINRELVPLDLKTRVDHDDMSGEDTNRYSGIEHRFVCINFRDGLFRCRREQEVVPFVFAGVSTGRLPGAARPFSRVRCCGYMLALRF